MLAVTSHSRFWMYVVAIISSQLFASAAESGQNVTLTCRASNNKILSVVWRRTDMESGYVLFYRDEQLVPDEQHESFKDRVDLQDRQMKDGDVSLILKNVTTADGGTYECCGFMEETRSWKLINTTTLVVGPPGHKGGAVGHIVGLTVSAVLLAAAAFGFVIYKKHTRKSQASSQPPSVEFQPLEQV